MPTVLQSQPNLVPETAAPILAVNNIEVVYDHVILVLKGVSLTVPRGGIVALLGANGAGKTTTLKAISNLLRAERSEEHTSELQSRQYLVCRLLLEKKKKKQFNNTISV